MREIHEGMIIADRWRVVTALDTAGAGSWRVVGPDGRDGEFLTVPGVAVETLDQLCRRAIGKPHENLLMPLESFEWDGVACLVRELPPGMNLDEWQRRERRLDMDQALGIACQLCLASTEAAKRGIGFIGFAPERVTVTPDGFARVDATGALQVPADDPWRSPEERHGETADERSDVFRIALITHLLLSGTRTSVSAAGVTLPGLHAMDEKIPAELDALLQRATASNPGERPENSEQLLDGLHPLLMERPLPGDDIPTRWYEDKRFWLYVAGGLIVLLLIASLFTGQFPFIGPK